MSRIGKLPVELPAGVTATLEDGNVLKVKGPKGELTQKFNCDMEIKIDGNTLTVSRPSDSKQHKATHGLTRALIANMVHGVTHEFVKELEIVGVGYRAAMQGSKMTLNMGFSHPVEIEQPKGITFEVPSPTAIVIKGIDKQQVGQVAANVRGIRPPEPYKGKGIRYKNEYVRRKEGKTGM